MPLDANGNFVSGLGDSLQARLQQERNPNVSTDQGVNSVSPYFLGATPGTTNNRIQQLSQGWSQTADTVAAYDAQGQAKIAAANAQKAAQAAAAQANKLSQQLQSGAIAADAANQKRLAALRQQAGSYYTGGGYVAGSGGFNSKGSNGLGVDAQSRATYLHAIQNGYAGRIALTNYSKSYTYDPTISAERNKILADASSYVGTRYVLGGASHQSIDCSGLVMSVYNQLGYHLDHSAADQGGTGGRGMAHAVPGIRTSLNNLKPGDLVAWRDGSHIAIWLGNGYIEEAGNANIGTVKRKLWADPSQVVGIHLNI